jgi:hypothetical protein
MPDAGAPSRDRVGRLAPWIALALAAAGAAIRLLHVPGVVHQENPLGLLRSDPALLYYITARVVEHGGRLPDDFRADPRIEWPSPPTSRRRSRWGRSCWWPGRTSATRVSAASFPSTASPTWR